MHAVEKIAPVEVIPGEKIVLEFRPHAHELFRGFRQLLALEEGLAALVEGALGTAGAKSRHGTFREGSSLSRPVRSLDRQSE